MNLTLKLAFKNLFSKQNSSLINLLGLVIAFVSVFYIYSYVSFELGYDSHNEKVNRIYRVSGDIIAAENTMTHAILGPLLGPALKKEYPVVENFARLIPIQRTITLETSSGKFDVDEAYSADHSVFDIFTLEFIYGDEKSALQNVNELVINQSLSYKIYGEKNPIGNTLKIGNDLYTLSGVIKDSPENAHHKLNILMSVEEKRMLSAFNNRSSAEISEGYWMPAVFTFILLKQGTKIESITENFQPFYDKYMAAFGNQINAKFQPVVIPLKKLHFSPHMSYDFPKGNRMYTYAMIIAAFFILFIAVVNYSNLLISQNIIQAKSYGIRKIVGAPSSGFYVQCLTNSFLIIFTAILLSLVAFWFSNPLLQQLIPFEFNADAFRRILILSLVLLFVIGILTALIPFFDILTKRGLQLIMLSDNNKQFPKRIKFGSASTIMQYTLSIILIMAVLGITRQLNFVMKSEMGFDKNNILLVKLTDPTFTNSEILTFKEELKRNSFISGVSYSSNIPGDVMGTSHFPIEREGKKVTKIIKKIGIDHDYIPLMGMEFKEGYNFDQSLNERKYSSIIVNEAFIDFCGFNDSIVGSNIEGSTSTVIGLLKDVRLNSLHNPADPMVFYLDKGNLGYLNVKLNTSEISEALKSIETTWKGFFKDVPFEFQFMDNRISKMYEEDQKISTLLKLFTLISIIISVMGLLNLSNLIMKRKTKEIGIRKANGARIKEVMIMLNKDFVKWVAIAFVIACPIAWYSMHKWLENFAYKTELSWWIFVLAGLLALGIALMTVSCQSWKAARRNPVEALRYE